MKKIFLLTILLFQLTFVFGQTSGFSNGNTKLWPDGFGASTLNCNDNKFYTEWRNISCYSKLKYRLKAVSLGEINGEESIHWEVRFQNNYTKKINIKFKLYVGDELRYDDYIGVLEGQHWGFDCAGGAGAELSESMSLNYELEIEFIKEDLRGTPIEEVEAFQCDGGSTVPTYKSYYPKTNNQSQSTTNSSLPQTKAQKQADAVNKLNDLFNVLVNPKKN